MSKLRVYVVLKFPKGKSARILKVCCNRTMAENIAKNHRHLDKSECAVLRLPVQGTNTTLLKYAKSCLLSLIPGESLL